MNRIVFIGACAGMLTIASAVEATPTSLSRPGLDRALTRMNAQGAAHQQATTRGNPLLRPERARATPAVPATPATPATRPTTPGSAATPATPAIPATPAVPPSRVPGE